MVELVVPDTILMRCAAENSIRNTNLRKRWLSQIGTVLLLCPLVLIYSGCALHKPPSAAKVVQQALPKATPLPSNWKANSSTANVNDNWLKSFKDPGLERVVSEAMENNLDLRQSAAGVEAARQKVIVIGSQLKPQIGATFGVADVQATNSLSGQNEQFHSSIEYAVVSWEPDIWGRLRAQRASAQANYQAVALDYAFARQSLAATTAKSWYLAIETRQLLALAEQSVSIYEELLELVKVRRAAGKVADLDVAEASYQLAEAQNKLTIAQGRYSEARRTLEVLVGRYPAAELVVAESFAPLPPPVAAGMPSSLLERRPDIMSAEREVLAAFRAHEAAKLALLPSFALTVEGGHLADRILDVLQLNPWLVRSAAGMFVPIYRGGALLAQVRIATAQQEQSIAYFGRVALTAFAEVEVGLTNEGLLAKRLPLTQSAYMDHKDAVRLARLRYQAGSIDFLSVLQLQQGEIVSQEELIKLRNAQLANRINLHLALGGSFDSSPASAYR